MSLIVANECRNRPDWRAEFKRLEGAFAPATIKGYIADITDFVDWCDENGYAPFPAEVEAVCQYLVDVSHKVAPSTVQRRCYAIAKAHRLMRLADPTKDEAVYIAIRRVRRAKPCRPKQAKGLNADYLQAFLAVQPETPWGLRNKAMLSLGYDILARRSELVAITTQEVHLQSDGTLRVLVRRAKADPFGMGRLAFTSRRTARLVQQWLEWRGPDIEPLFCGIYQQKPINRALGVDSVKLLIKRSAKLAGLDPRLAYDFSGHSLRVGAAQDLLCKGFDTAAIMRAGGWKSVNVLARYLEYAEHNVWAGDGPQWQHREREGPLAAHWLQPQPGYGVHHGSD